MTPIEYPQMLDYVGLTAEATTVVFVDDEFECNYHDVVFSDGFTIYAISGYHLELL